MTSQEEGEDPRQEVLLTLGGMEGGEGLMRVLPQVEKKGETYSLGILLQDERGTGEWIQLRDREQTHLNQSEAGTKVPAVTKMGVEHPEVSQDKVQPRPQGGERTHPDISKILQTAAGTLRWVKPHPQRL